MHHSVHHGRHRLEPGPLELRDDQRTSLSAPGRSGPPRRPTSRAACARRPSARFSPRALTRCCFRPRVQQYGGDLTITVKGGGGGGGGTTGERIIPWIQNGILTNAIFFLLTVVVFSFFSFSSLCSMAGPCARAMKKTGKGFLIGLSAGIMAAQACCCVHFSSLVQYVEAVKDFGQEKMNPPLYVATCVFMFLTAFSLSLFLIAGVLILDDAPLQLTSNGV